MTIRVLLAAVLLAPAAAFAQGWGGQGSDPNGASASAAAPEYAPAPAPKAAPKAKAKAARAESDENGLDDAGLERSRVLVDRQLASRKSALANQTARLEGYHLAMEKDSMDAERQMAEERKAFLLYLKSVPQEDRAAAMKNFEERQAGKRKDLDKRHLSQYKAWFDENISSNWRSQPLASEQVSMPASVAAAPEPPAESAAPAPAPRPVAVRAKVKKRRKQ